MTNLCYFLTFGLKFFFEIAYNDSLQQRLTSSRNKIHDKELLGPHLGQTSQNRHRNYFFPHFLKFGSLIGAEVSECYFSYT